MPASLEKGRNIAEMDDDVIPWQSNLSGVYLDPQKLFNSDDTAALKYIAKIHLYKVCITYY